MSQDRAQLWFYLEDNRITERRSNYIPRVGELVGLLDQWFEVVEIRWTFVSPDSVNYRDGIMNPIVDVICVEYADGGP